MKLSLIPRGMIALASAAALATAGGYAATALGASSSAKKCDDLCRVEKRLVRNKHNVVAYYTLALNGKNPALAVKLYGGPFYIQHNPLAGNGFPAFIKFFKSFEAQYPDAHITIKRVIAEGDLVVTHSLLTGAKPVYGPRGTKAVDIFRLNSKGKIVEHWDVLAQISPTSANGNPEV